MPTARQSSHPQPARAGHCLCFKTCLASIVSYMHHAGDLFTGRPNSFWSHLLNFAPCNRHQHGTMQYIRHHIRQDTCSHAEFQYTEQLHLATASGLQNVRREFPRQALHANYHVAPKFKQKLVQSMHCPPSHMPTHHAVL